MHDFIWFYIGNFGYFAAHYNQDSVILVAIWSELQLNKAEENQLHRVPGLLQLPTWS